MRFRPNRQAGRARAERAGLGHDGQEREQHQRRREGGGQRKIVLEVEAPHQREDAGGDDDVVRRQAHDRRDPEVGQRGREDDRRRRQRHRRDQRQRHAQNRLPAPGPGGPRRLFHGRVESVERAQGREVHQRVVVDHEEEPHAPGAVDAERRLGQVEQRHQRAAEVAGRADELEPGDRADE